MPTHEEIDAAKQAINDLKLSPGYLDNHITGIIVMVALQAAEHVRHNNQPQKFDFTRHDVRHHDYHDWTHPLIREDRPE